MLRIFHTSPDIRIVIVLYLEASFDFCNLLRDHLDQNNFYKITAIQIIALSLRVRDYLDKNNSILAPHQVVPLPLNENRWSVANGRIRQEGEIYKNSMASCF